MLPVGSTLPATAEEITAAEMTWLASNYPGARAELNRGRYILSTRVIHAVPVRLPDGRELVVHFDIAPSAK